MIDIFIIQTLILILLHILLRIKQFSYCLLKIMLKFSSQHYSTFLIRFYCICLSFVSFDFNNIFLLLLDSPIFKIHIHMIKCRLTPFSFILHFLNQTFGFIINHRSVFWIIILWIHLTCWYSRAIEVLKVLVVAEIFHWRPTQIINLWWQLGPWKHILILEPSLSTFWSTALCF